ncbi:ATPase [Methylobacterium indicum]|uniref:histidine kinase n=2 Tax=Methylobacterium indicum TaxID=1775910 RepID=A0A8H8WTZ1_9HYPH|nr:PAS domain-containing sensor histidine kinase [Methylobacterium indicum]KTS21542.1 ATPase [Methylobacterium indicum]KTS41689.1 ATPase [Methylobacterium indicum]KTS43126.1 ATPase [Methylobacterium indicum]BCM84208.1 PAS domain-containing sensor histidine kinase [Methylobacterium indicum]
MLFTRRPRAPAPASGPAGHPDRPLPPGSVPDAAPRGPGWFGALAVIVALALALVTFLILVGATAIAPTHTVVVALLLSNVALVLLLVVVIAWEARVFLRARRTNAAAARLHTRIVGLFSLIATLPTVLLAVVASITLERGLSPWFSDRMRNVVLMSVDVADAYLTNQCQSLAREARILSDDLTRARPAFDVERAWFESFLTARAASLGLPIARIMRSPTETVARANIDILKDPPLPSASDFEEAAKSPDATCLLPREGRVFGTLMKLPAYDDAFLLVEREVTRLAVEFPGVSRAAATEFLTIDAGRRSVQIAFATMFALIALIALLSAVWFGLNFANRFVAPIRRLINAADQVASGNYYAQVPFRKTEGDLQHLGESFNKMTQELSRQRTTLIEQSEQIDSRRRFTEAVLAGVPAGVIGVDGRGVITIANPSVERMLGRSVADLVGEPLAVAMPELGGLPGDARARPTQQQIQIARNGRERTIDVRTTSEQSQDGDRGYVVTLDDITDLVTAQRTSAWADVARRIAHEIKNPLTPIQLSAERIRRKYGKVITVDKDIFEQCVATIVRQVDDIKRMVDEFSSFARMPKPAIARNDLTEIVKQNLFMMRVAHPDVAFTLEEGVNRVSAAFDTRLLSQAITNILKNAVEAVQAVPEETRGESLVAVRLYEEGEAAVIEITDTGKGFPAEGRQRLLEPYMTTREGGTGLGLAIVSKVLEEHGGGIELNDNPRGRGGQVRMRVLREMRRDEPAEAGRARPVKTPETPTSPATSPEPAA